jgi:hypothetical protein
MRTLENIFMSLLLAISIGGFGMGEVLSQPAAKGEKGPQIKLGEITFQMQEYQSTPSSVRMFEVRVEIQNHSSNAAAPPRSVKVVVTPKEIKYAGPKPAKDLSFQPEEVILDAAIPPQMVRLLIVGFSLPQERMESATFEVQINPPTGEKKTVTWQREKR